MAWNNYRKSTYLRCFYCKGKLDKSAIVYKYDAGDMVKTHAPCTPQTVAQSQNNWNNYYR